MKKLSLIKNGIFDENPVLRLVLGTCPTLAISTSVVGGLGMGLAATFVLICSNMAISALRKVIPGKIRIPAYITIVAGFVTVVMMLVEAFLPDLNAMLGIYLPLIVVNCIVLGRAEVFASKNPVIDSAFDGLGMGLGFTATLVVMGCVRELIGAGTIFDMRVFPQEYSIGIMVMSPGGFFTFGCAIALLSALLQKRGSSKKLEVSCSACGGCDKCNEEGCGK
ncbi:MAG: electron transport complex subunit E [Oscillospiraceae bacterium]